MNSNKNVILADQLLEGPRESIKALFTEQSELLFPIDEKKRLSFFAPSSQFHNVTVLEASEHQETCIFPKREC